MSTSECTPSDSIAELPVKNAADEFRDGDQQIAGKRRVDDFLELDCDDIERLVLQRTLRRTAPEPPSCHRSAQGASSEGSPLGLSKRPSASIVGVPMRSDAWNNLFSGGSSGQAASHGILPPISLSCLVRTLAGICSRDLEKAKAFQSEFGAARAFADLDAMAGDPGIDAIYIATPNAAHAEQALQAIAHGKPVLVEKPLATSVADAERIASAAGGSQLLRDGGDVDALSAGGAGSQKAG